MNFIQCMSVLIQSSLFLVFYMYFLIDCNKKNPPSLKFHVALFFLLYDLVLTVLRHWTHPLIMSLAMQGTGSVTPGYSYNYPSRSLKLTAVKKGIFNPRLPTIRQMDRDTNMSLMSDEHCRTTTTLGPGLFYSCQSLVTRQLQLRHFIVKACRRSNNNTKLSQQPGYVKE